MRETVKDAIKLLEKAEQGDTDDFSPTYRHDVKELFQVLQQTDFYDVNYSSKVVLFKNIEDYDFIKQASLEDLKTLLTCCLKGEYFGIGFFGKMLKSGYIRSILEAISSKLNTPAKIKKQMYGKRLYKYMVDKVAQGYSDKMIADLLNDRNDDSTKVWDELLVREHMDKHK